MEATLLTVSPQGQITLPKKWRDEWLAGQKKPKLVAWQEKPNNAPPIVTISPQPASWVKAVAGSSKNLWGKVDQYIKRERNQWTR
jgi:hypothetical protein